MGKKQQTEPEQPQENKQRTLQDLSVNELKAIAYDIGAQINGLRAKLQAVEQELQGRKTE